MSTARNSRKSTALLTATFCGTLLLAGSLPASAADRVSQTESAESTASNPCKRQNYRKVVYTFYRGPERVLLRCGTDSWGYNHIVGHGRWSKSFKNKIEDTLFKGVQTSTGVYHRYPKPTGCHRPIKNFKVVFNQGPYSGDHGSTSPQGIITAVEEYTFAASAETGGTAKC
ncbi:hypothetical protein V7793_00020 [Streptomyces sp. KLMMK]|uniref:hypothetical protein n=1 Tax=Streptomyces sp. KLMMK TaxID=3109353 RepID=UPI002FFF2AD9